MTARQRRADIRAAALAAVRVETAPAERWNHGQAEAPSVGPRMPTSVASGVLALRRGKAIGDSEVTAAERFARDYIFGVEGVRDPAEGPGGGGSVHDVQIARAEAITSHRAIAELIGAAMTQWLVSFVVLDLTFTAMAERFMPGRKHGRVEMRGRLTTLLTLLSQLYASLDRRPQRPCSA